jgi:lysophospholipase L1-like esterase
VRVVRHTLALALVAAAALAVTTNAQERAPFLGADFSAAGHIDLYFFGAVGTTVTFSERVGDALEPLGAGTIENGDKVPLRPGPTWRCDRQTRSFVATGTGPDGAPVSGSFDLRTPSCRDRLAVTLPRRAADGAAQLRVDDRWRLGGLPVRLCLEPPRGAHTCRLTGLPGGTTTLERRLALPHPGRWVVELRFDHFRLRRAVTVGGGPAAPAAPVRRRFHLLTTGDSIMQGIDAFLDDALSDVARVDREFIPGSGISQQSDWPAIAREQAARFKPRLTVISIGANDGYPMPIDGRQVACCEEAWKAEYARRAREVMLAFARGGAGRVLWLDLPAPRDRRLATIIDAVNEAVARAAVGLPAVRVLPLAALISPKGKWQRTLRVGGRTVTVRTPDGIHLSVGGIELAAGLVEDALRQGAPLR